MFFAGRTSWRSGNDIGQLYDNATPDPTGSLSGPYFVEGRSKAVIGIKGKTSNIACSIKNLGNMTVSKIFLDTCCKYFYNSKRCTDQGVKSVNAIHVSFPISSGDLIILAANCNLYSISAVYNYLLLSVQSLLLNQPNTAPHTSIQTCQPCKPMFDDVLTNRILPKNL